MRKIIVLFGFLCAICVQAQDYKFGKVSKEELEQKFNSTDSSASATYLYKYRNSFFEYTQEKGFELITEVYERVKIYNKDGFDYATKQLSLYKSNSNEENFTGLKASTYNLEKGKVVESKISKSAIFENEASKYKNKVKFTMPNIKEGCVIEYKYKIMSPFLSNVDDYVFQYDIPINKLYAKFQSPEYFVFKVNTKGFFAVTPKVERKTGRILINTKTRSSGSGFSSVRTSFESSQIEYITNVSTYELDNVPAMKEEPYVNNINNYRSSINYELSYTQFPYSRVEYYSTTWEDVVKNTYENEDFGGQLKKTGYYENEVDALLASVSDPKQKVTFIYDFVKSQVKWNGYYGYLTDVGVKKAYKEKVGNVAEINLMLTSMLRYAGIRAYPVLVSTRNHGIPLFPTREGYNYVITCAKFDDGSEVLLDATSSYCHLNVLPFKALNWKGRAINEQGNSTFVDLYPKKLSQDITVLMIDLNEDGSIHGSCRKTKSNYRALTYREKYNGIDKDDYIEKLDNKYNGIDILEFEVKNSTDLGKPIVETFEFEKESQADIVGDKLYFSPLFFFKENENPFKLENREYPVDFGYPFQTSFRIIINLPEGYKIESLPEKGAFSLPENLGIFQYNVVGMKNQIQVTIKSRINSSIIGSEYYVALKTFFSEIVNKEAEQIVLTKV
ncbi:transglutaminase domain-containing protein [Tamlana fucoidanivorans]|uniref:DUF3857 domain-containing protein n=1 Tax=Allotamlana fucoidanivorans TaxID=2583814 RepID=A0A5C4SQG8_9FLAO|nr:transglutaminase-like domain-containing protein [Tamlana fucoidanivorans]TNJ46176.1 DUF3857 domain-containing protein [Tamlana fucoidanivorans]